MLRNFYQILRGYEPYEIILEMAVIWLCVYIVYRFLRGTRGAGVIKGFAVLFVLLTLLIRVIGQGTDTFGRLNFIYERFLGLLAILLIVVFQPELRQAMVRLGRARWFRSTRTRMDDVIDAVTSAVTFLSKNEFGALIALERSVKLGGLTEGGVQLDAEVSPRLLQTIFWPNSPLHDLGVVIRGNRIVAASVQFPLVEEDALREHLGSRHRAGLGLSLESDCLVVIVSEETGQVSIAEHGQLDRNIPLDAVADELRRRLTAVPPPAEDLPPLDEEEHADEAVDKAERPKVRVSSTAGPPATASTGGEARP